MISSSGRSSPQLCATRPLVRLLVGCALLVALRPPLLAQRSPVPFFQTGGATGGLFFIDLTSGATFQAEVQQLGRRLRIRALDQNLFETIGRRAPAQPGELLLTSVFGRGGRTDALLLIETSTGYLAYLNRIGKGSKLGELRSAAGRPAESLAAADGNFALLTVRSSTGYTTGAYLYHGTTGGCLYLTGFENVEQDPTATPCEALPRLSGPISEAEVRDSAGRTRGFLAADAAAGTVHFLAAEPAGPGALSASRADLTLGQLFPEEPSRQLGRRFQLAPIFAAGAATSGVLVADGAVGKLALIPGPIEGTALTATLLDLDLARYLPSLQEGGGLSLVPLCGPGGRTEAVWVLTPSAQVALIITPLDPLGEIAVEVVEMAD